MPMGQVLEGKAVLSVRGDSMHKDRGAEEHGLLGEL